MKGVPLNEDLYNYIINTFIYEDDILKEIVRKTEEKKLPVIQVPPEVGKLLAMFIKIINAKYILEIGTLTGYSTVWMARALPDNGKITTLEISNEHATEAINNFKIANIENKIEIIVGDAIKSLDKLTDRTFDLVFIDADKENCVSYFNKVIKLVRCGGIIITDNTLRRGEVLMSNPSTGTLGIIEYNKLVAKDKRVESILIPIGDGITVSIKL